MVKIYKIRRTTDELFSTGGWHPVFAEKGKVWATRGAISGHFSNFDEPHKNKLYKDCEVVCYEVSEVAVETTPVYDWRLSDSTVRAKMREQEQLEQAAKEEAAREIAELERRLKRLKGTQR